MLKRCIVWTRWPLLAALAALLCLGLPARTYAQAPPRPNIVFILMDDLRWDDLACMGHPFVKTPNVDRLAREGALFTNAYATTPLCSPSRACILTGLYAHSHGIRDNTDRSSLSHKLVTFLLLLQRAGYDTAFIGKWHMGVDDAPRPGIDHWVCFKGQGQYLDPELNVNGTRQKRKGYATDILTDEAVSFIQKERARPFVLYLSHKAVHPNLEQRADGSISDPTASNFLPAERHKNLYADAKIPRRPNALIDKLEGKPALMRQLGNLPSLSRKTGTPDSDIRNRLRMLMAAEEGVGRIYQALADKNMLDKTLIVFTSDHGYFYGEHGLNVERRLAYEETARIPLIMRFPPLIKAGTKVDAFALTIDLAPTFLDMAGATPHPRPFSPKGEKGEGLRLHGRSLVPLLKDEKPPWRKSFLIEYFSDKVFPRMDKMGYQAVRTERWQYIHYVDLKDVDELYDLKNDPYEMHNLIGRPDMRPTLTVLQKELESLLRESQ